MLNRIFKNFSLSQVKASCAQSGLRPNSSRCIPFRMGFRCSARAAPISADASRELALDPVAIQQSIEVTIKVTNVSLDHCDSYGSQNKRYSYRY